MQRQLKTTLSTVAIALAGLLGAAACDLDVPDLNNPGLDQLAENPTPSRVSAACTGLLIGTRAGTSAPNGFVSQLGILGRESYNFDGADPRYVNEMLEGPLQPGSPFGGAFWAGPYANIRLANIVLTATASLPDFDDSQKAAIRGFTNTVVALDLLRVIVTRDTIGAVIDTDREIDDIGPIADKSAVYAEINALLDDAADDLADGSDAFPFLLSSGFAGFDTPATFIQVNRALRARVAVYEEDYDGALDALEASFLDPAGSFNLGAYHVFTTGTGDVQNGLVNPNIYAHPSFETDAQTNGDTIDARFSSKVARVPQEEAGTAGGLSSDLVFTAYTPTASVPIIRNEELILLRAEAEWGNGDLASAIADLNIVRVGSGGLEPLADGLDAAAVEEEILYNRRYSLMFEGGHRWIDMKRFGRTEPCSGDTTNCLPLDLPDHVINLRYPLPTAECDGRPGEAVCTADPTAL